MKELLDLLNKLALHCADEHTIVVSLEKRMIELEITVADLYAHPAIAHPALAHAHFRVVE